MGFWQRIFGTKENKEIQKDYIKLFVSENGKKAGISNIPFALYGHMADISAGRISNDTTLSCIAIAGSESLKEVMKEIPIVGVSAMSRTEFVGEAESIIKMYRQNARIPGMALYGAWDYNVDRAARRAINCGADGIMMPGIHAKDYYSYLFGVLKEVQNGSHIPKTVDEHLERLKKYTTHESPFWEMQNYVESKFY